MYQGNLGFNLTLFVSVDKNTVEHAAVKFSGYADSDSELFNVLSSKNTPPEAAKEYSLANTGTDDYFVIIELPSNGRITNISHTFDKFSFRCGGKLYSISKNVLDKSTAM